MVIASNEWLNNYEDEQKSASATTTANTTNTTPPTITTTATTADNAATATVTGTTSPPTDIQTIPNPSATAAATTAADNANNISNNDRQHQAEEQQQQQEQSMINTNFQIMDDSLKSEKESNEQENNNLESSSTTSINNSNSNSNSNTSLQSVVGNINSSNATNANNINSNSILNQNQISPNFNPNPITPQALSNALQSALNATNNYAPVAGNLQNSFLSSLGVGVSPNATLQHTANLAKQLSSSLCGLESQTNLNNSTLEHNAADNMRDHQQDNNGQAKIILHCEPNSHHFQTRTILLTPNIECKVGRLIAKSKASESNAIFDCKVLSRNHAVLWYSNDGKFWVKDTKSSNGTFINDHKLGIEAAELHFGDVVKFGVDVVENMRKEVHGCVIAGVKLFLPDGRETISIESNAQLSQHSGEGRISFDELHRLNLYMQEASQREKVLTSKLYNIQNILDATRKNSALCWQSMIAEDQLLHRIHSLEKKLQLMEKNVPENVLRNEVLKLLDDKSSYQHSAKEALRKVYQERCDAMQLLSKMESAYTTSDNECKILRDQIMNTKQSLQDVNARLLCLETEYNEYKEETDRQQEEAKEQTEQRTAELTEQLQQRELECEELRRKISELLLKRAELLDEEQLQQQAIEKLDAAIADMELGDDDEDEVDDDDVENNEKIDIDKATKTGEGKETKSVLYNSDEVNGDSVVDAGSEKKLNSANLIDGPPEANKQRVGKKSTILKWLENSDLNKKEGSLDIFEAICNESDSSDEQETSLCNETGAGTETNSKSKRKNKSLINDNKREDFVTKCSKFNKKLRHVQQNLTQLEAEIANETNKTSSVNENLDDGSAVIGEEDEDSDEDADDVDEEKEVMMKSNGKLTSAEHAPVVSKDNKSYSLLKTSVTMLREAFNEICDSMQQQEQNQTKQQSPPPAISVQTQFQNYSQHNPSNSAAKKLLTQVTLKPNADATSDSDDEDHEYDEDDDASEATTRISQTSLLTIKEVEEVSQPSTTESGSNCSSSREQQIEKEIKDYQKHIEKLNKKLDHVETDSQNILEIMQIECDTFKDKVVHLSKLVDTLRDEKHALEQVISENKSNAQKSAECCNDELVISEQLLLLEKKQQCQQPISDSDVGVTDTSATSGNGSEKERAQENTFEQQMRDELAAINDAAVQREEELIMYKERLEQTQSDNIKLRDEIADMKLKANDQTQLLLKRMVPYGAVVIAILVYFIFTYF